MAAQITPLPSVPSRQDPTNFNDRADAFLGALPTFQSEANALSTEVNTRADNVQAANNAVLAATNITKWVSGTTYAQGVVVWSPINGLGYRRITASGSGTTDPSSDTTNYKQVNGTGDVSTSGDQTIAGVKTFSTPIAVGSGGTGASTAADAFNNLKQAATESYAGVIELATNGEVQTGTDNTRAITPASLRASKVVTTGIGVGTGTFVDLPQIPSWVRTVTVIFSFISTNGTSPLVMTTAGATQIFYGTHSTASATSVATTSVNGTLTFQISGTRIANAAYTGTIELHKTENGTFYFKSSIGGTGTDNKLTTSVGYLSPIIGTTAIRISTTGSDVFNGGTFILIFE